MGAVYQSLSLLVVGHADRSERAWQQPNPSLFGPIHAAALGLPHPIGSDIPDPKSYQLASLDTRDPDFTGSIPAVADPWDVAGAFPNLPTINRASKGDRLDKVAARTGDKLVQGDPAFKTHEIAKGDRLVPAHPLQLASKPTAPGGPPEEPSEIPAVTDDRASAAPSSAQTFAQTPIIPEPTNARPDTVARQVTTRSQSEWVVPTPPNATVHTARLYFGVETDDEHAVLEPWSPGEEPGRAAQDTGPSENGVTSGPDRGGGAKSKDRKSVV